MKAALRAIAPSVSLVPYLSGAAFWQTIDTWLEAPPLDRCLAHLRASGSVESLALLDLDERDMPRVVDLLLEKEAEARAQSTPHHGVHGLTALWLLEHASPATVSALLPRITPSRWIEHEKVNMLRRGVAAVPPAWVGVAHPAIARDPLGGAWSKGALLHDVVDFVTPARPAAYPGRWLLCGDLDLLKTLNDRHGPRIGDAVIRETIEAFQRVVGDTVIRYGGEEFLVVYDGNDGPALAEELRQLIASTEMGPFGPDNVKVRATISFGVAQSGRRDSLQRADMALFDAKRGGRNRVVVAPT